eukprot:CAMPEP_0185020728 /NCGR_PEP_ID=MMETSP1103-20130426/3361_1 /TAXON_ID=36769 /ORGANISM="Paraphysomonas bandaiensis, Strain Caron Lab Isolate" /LENGTH=549 /DNA_ID=CAMNT_0027551801 /DNA_START=554 /DNA_END=2203 /DNA_ORIENTATION=+
MLLQYRRTLMRPLGVRITRCSNLQFDPDSSEQPTCNPFVYISTSDTREISSQIWLKHTTVVWGNEDPEYNEDFIVPGINGNQSVVFTVVCKTDRKHKFMGQAVLDLSFKNLWCRGGSFMLPLRSVQYILQEHKMPIPLDYSAVEPSGTLEVQLFPLTSIDNFCGRVYGPRISDLMIAFRDLSANHSEHRDPENKAVFGEGLAADSKRIRKSTLWLVLTGGRIYLHDELGEPCRMFIDLKLTTVQAKNRFDTLWFDIKIDGCPTLKFAATDRFDENRFKAAMMSAWRKSKVCRFQLTTLVEDLIHIRLLKKQADEDSSRPGRNLNATRVHIAHPNPLRRRRGTSFLPSIAEKYSVLDGEYARKKSTESTNDCLTSLSSTKLKLLHPLVIPDVEVLPEASKHISTLSSPKRNCETKIICRQSPKKSSNRSILTSLTPSPKKSVARNSICRRNGKVFFQDDMDTYDKGHNILRTSPAHANRDVPVAESKGRRKQSLVLLPSSLKMPGNDDSVYTQVFENRLVAPSYINPALLLILDRQPTSTMSRSTATCST